MRIFSFILLVDSYLLRKGLVSVLNRIQGVRVMKEFGTNDPFIPFLENHPVDYIIICQAAFDRSVDLFMSRPDFLERLILLKESSCEDAADKTQGKDLQASIHPGDDRETIVKTIRDLLNHPEGGQFESSSLRLSPRETTIVRLVSMGLTNRQIAEKLFLSAHTVMTHRKNINSKLGIKSVSGLTIYAIVNNIITIEEISSLPEP